MHPPIDYNELIALVIGIVCFCGFVQYVAARTLLSDEEIDELNKNQDQ